MPRCRLFLTLQTSDQETLMSDLFRIASNRLVVMALGIVALLLPNAPGSFIYADEAGSTTKKELARSRPEQQGISSTAILAFVEEADKKIENMNSFMLVR